MYSFYKHFQSLNTPLIRKYYCSLCFQILNSEKSICKNFQQSEVAYFIEILILRQLQKLYKRPGFLQHLRWRFQIRKRNIAHYEDIYDGKIYTRIYLYQADIKMRYQIGTNNFSVEANLINVSSFNIEGEKIISIMATGYIRSTGINPMHCVEIGVVKALLLLWLQPRAGLLLNCMHIVNEKICLISPPDFVSRFPRSLWENLSYLKASQLKTCFFCYPLPIMQIFMPALYFNHYMLLVYSIYILSQPTISDKSVNLAEQLIHEFVMQFSDLYGLKNMTCNLHSLLHLPQNVRDFGPLYTTSCFPYENANGILKKLVTGTKFAQLQICSTLSLSTLFIYNI